VIVAAVSSKPGRVMLSALPVTLGAGLLIVLTVWSFGYMHGAEISDGLDRMRHWLSSLVLHDELPKQPMEPEDDIGPLDRAAIRLAERYRGELVLYRDAIEEVAALGNETTVFIERVAREMGAPLARVVRDVDDLLAGDHGPLVAAQEEDLRIIRQATERLQSLVDDVLDLSSLVVGNVELERATVDLREVAAEVVAATRGSLSGGRVLLRLETPEDGPTEVLGNRQRLWQILMNLVGNAVKFTDEGEVRVTVSAQRGGQPCVTVSDTGCGIPSKEIDGLFDAFRQRGEISKRRRGTGLGLAIVKRLVDLHHGSIEVDSQVGRGSEFKIFFEGRT